MRAVICDIGGVLVSQADWSSLLGWAAAFDMSPADFRDRLAAVDLKGAIVGDVTEAEMRTELSQALGLSAEQAGAFAHAVWDLNYGEPDKTMIEFVQSLRPAVRTGLLSNAIDGSRREQACRFGFDSLTDDLVYSCEVRLAKPDPAIYRLACDRLEVRPEEAIFVDDRVENVWAAADLGMLALLHTGTVATMTSVRGFLA